MDFMDPRRRRRYSVMLLTGYILIGIAITLLAVILMFVVYGFGYKNGQVIQNGLVFLSSSPNPAEIYIDGQRYKSNTNTRMVIPAGSYSVTLRRAGYRDWQRTIQVDGGDVQSFTYPFLFPLSLTTNTVRDYETPPTLVTQSPNDRWLLVSRPGSLTSFDLYDLNDVKKAPLQLDLPSALLAGAAQGVQVVGWASDNDHLLVQYTSGSGSEYVLMNRPHPEQSVNLTRTFALPSTGVQLQLSNQHFDQYLMYNTTVHILSRLQLNAPAPQPYVNDVLAFKTLGDNTVLYATPSTTLPGKVDIRINDSGNDYLIRTCKSGTTYLLDLDKYGGDLFVAVAAQSEGVVYIYRNPAGQIQNKALAQAIPIQVFRLDNPTFVTFSADAHYVVFENNKSIAAYDTDRLHGWVYTLPGAPDAPQTHAEWLDDARLDYVSHGQLIAFDYDGTNKQVLVSASPAYQSYLTPNAKYLYAFAPSVSDRDHRLLTSTALRTPADM